MLKFAPDTLLALPKRSSPPSWPASAESTFMPKPGVEAGSNSAGNPVPSSVTVSTYPSDPSRISERLVAQSSCGVDGRYCLCGHISLRGQHLLGGDQARGERSDAGIQGGLARNATPLGILFALLVGFIAVEVWIISIKQRSRLRPRPAHFVLSFSSPELSPKNRRRAFTL
jgi:hypothetical protein